MKNNISQRGAVSVPVVVLIIAVIVIGGGFIFYGANKSEQLPADEAADFMEKDKTTEDSDAMMKDGDAMEKGPSTSSGQDGDSMEKENGAVMEENSAMADYEGQIIAGKSSPLIDFNKADYEAVLKTDKLVVLYFYANWCPICKQEVSSALYPAFNELAGENVVGFRVNYNDNQTDNDEKALAKEFGVGYQHTKVFLKNGQRILKAPDSWSKDRYLSEINKAI